MASPAAGGSGETSIQMLPDAAASSSGDKSRCRASAAAKSEETLNHFVRFLAFGEWAGNAFGTLAFLWATVVLLGGFSMALDPTDFWYATAMIFIEAFRMFNHNYRLDDDSLFTTTRALRWISAPFVRMPMRRNEWNEVMAIMGLSICIFNFLFAQWPLGDAAGMAMAALIIFTSKLPFPGELQLIGRRRWYLQLLLWAILNALLAIAALDLYVLVNHMVTQPRTKMGKVLARPDVYDVVNWCGSELAAMPPNVIAVMLLNLRPARIANITNRRSGRKLLIGAKVVLSLWLVGDVASPTVQPFSEYYYFLGRSFTILVLSLSSLQTPTDSSIGRWTDIALHICFLGELLTTLSNINSLLIFIPVLVVLFTGNLQIPAAVTRVVLSSLRLHRLAHHVYPKDSNPNLVPSIVVFYVLTLCQGTFYNVACILEIFSFFVRRSLARHSGFRGQWGVRAVDLYYQCVYTTCMETGVLAPGNMISLASFAIKSLSSSSHELQLAGVRVLDSLLQRRDYRKELISQVTKSSKAVSILTSMLGWKDVQDKHTRLFAARIIFELAGSLKIAVVPGMLSLVSSLLDADKQAKQGSLCQLSHGSGNDGMNMGDSPSSGRSSSAHSSGGNEIRGDTRNEPNIQIVQDCLSQAVRDNEENILGNQLPEQESSGQPDHGNGGNAGNRPIRYQLMFTREDNAGWRYWLHLKQRWRLIKEKWSIPKELPVTHQDSFPVLGMLILERLAYDLDNCAEIGRATDLISNIIAFISYDTITSNSDDEQQKTMACLSLNLVRRLANTGEKIGSKLRRGLWENPLLLRKFAGTLENSHSGPEIWEPAMDIIAKLAWDEEARQEIGSSQVIIGKLIHAFLGRGEHTNMYHDQPLRMVAGEALANLAIGSAANCKAILKEQGYDIIKDLKKLLYNIDYQYIAASLLQNLCTHCIDELQRPSSREQLSSALPMVMGTIISTEGKQLEVLIGLASQMCNIIPQLPNVLGMQSQVGVTEFVHKMMCTLHENMIPSPEYPRMRRVTLEMAISIMEECPCYATIFREKGMVFMLSKIEMTTQSKVEKYRVFFGNIGVVLETGVPLPVLASKAKGLIGSL
ncbi:unnamed protein product [Urochloa decumbens]|uniref:ARM repeat superfamily protein n=1 Tax=Urochloa decumbens TaxID=240449 RepID=A0ABC8Z5G1_9POAL